MGTCNPSIEISWTAHNGLHGPVLRESHKRCSFVSCASLLGLIIGCFWLSFYRYITCPLVSIVKADCIYKYVLAKRIMRPQAFRCTRQEPNRTTKQKKRRSKSTFLTKLRKKAKPDVRVESAVKNEVMLAEILTSLIFFPEKFSMYNSKIM